jgi:DNA-binding transcriptional regulator YbjK
MPSNVDRRRELADAGLAVLARDGARGLTHRAVDRQAEVPEGTAANYFRSRDALFGALGDRIMERLQPDPSRLGELEDRTPDLDLFTTYMRDLVERTTSAPELTLALFELRLEARRRPDLADVLGRTLRRGFRDDVAYATGVGFATEALDIALVRFAIEGLLLDLLTPSIEVGASTDEVIHALVTRLLGQAHAG